MVRSVLKKTYQLLVAWWLDEYLVKRRNERFSGDVREGVEFLFTKFSGRIVPNEREPPPLFDFARVTVEADDLRFSFTKDRGSVHVAVASEKLPGDWHDLSALLNVLGISEVEYSRLFTIARLLEANLSAIKEALSTGHIEQTKEALSEVYDSRSRAARRIEAQINRKIYGQ